MHISQQIHKLTKSVDSMTQIYMSPRVMPYRSIFLIIGYSDLDLKCDTPTLDALTDQSLRILN